MMVHRVGLLWEVLDGHKLKLKRFILDNRKLLHNEES